VAGQTEEHAQAAADADADESALFALPPSIPSAFDEAFSGRVVAIGASAGGLDALARVFKALPPDTGAAFVVIQHLSPDHKSMMADLLGRYTEMPVCVAEHDMALAANRVHLIPPGKMMRVAGDRLQLAPKPEHGLTLPIDTFFGSLAEQFADRAVAVVLSGTGSDGSRGVQEINAAGGIFYVQDPTTAKFDGMPLSASQAAHYDFMGSAEALAEHLTTQLVSPRAEGSRLLSPHAPAVAQPLDTIHEILLHSSGIDFRQYKPTTVLRRIERRMQVMHCPSLVEYRERLAGSPDEQVLLRRELLIPVTRFFRDSEVYELLAEQVIPDLVSRAGPEGIRAWVACCATGEEAYSIAMLFAEAFRKAGRTRPVKIFATDVEQQYLDHAAAGLYPDTIAAEVSPERLSQFFIERQGRYQVQPELRQMIIFARHNVIADPPFTRMNLVTCRNALIYLEPAAQESALRRLQYAMAPGAHLMLGPSESLGELHRDFQPLKARSKVYRLLRRDRSAATMDMRGLHHTRLGEPGKRGTGLPPMMPRPGNDGALALLMQHYAPPSVVVSEARQLMRVYGDTRQLLQFAEGQATLDLMKLLPRDLVPVASMLLQGIATDRSPQRSAPIRLPDGDGWRRVQLVARPLDGSDDGGFAMLSLETLTDRGPAAEADGTLAPAEPPDDRYLRRIEELERDLAVMHDNLQATIEELETSNEELQATNEELMASNEELQSTNEELQSVNEELYTVNSEYQEKVDVLNSVNADLENVSKAAAIPTVFVDEHLRLTRFTPEATPLFHLRQGDEGRSIEDFAHRLDYPSLFADLRQTLERGGVTEREVRSRNGQWWLARIQPYPGRTPGASRAVMTFVNIDSVKDSERLQAVIDSLPQHVAVVDLHGAITRVNEAWRRFATENGDPAERCTGPGHNYLRVCAEAALSDADARRAHEGLTAVLEGRIPMFQMHYPCHAPDQERWFMMYAAPIRHPAGGAVVSHVDISEWVRVSGGSLPDGSKAVS